MKLARYLTALLFAVILSACGGGGSSAPAPEAQPPGTPEPYVIAAYGDSTQAAQGHPHAASRPGAKIYNRGVGGNNTSKMLAGTDGVNGPWAEQIPRETVRIIVLNPGINDYGLTVEQYKANLNELVTIAQKAGKIVILEEPNPVSETMTPLMQQLNFDIQAFNERRAAMKHVANHRGVYFCAQPRAPLVDGIHPTVDGYAVKAGRLQKCIKDVLG